MTPGEPDQSPEARRVELGEVLPHPFNELFPLHEEARLQSATEIRGDVFSVLLAQTEALAWTCHWALSTEEGHDNPQIVAEALLVLAEYLSTMRRIARLLEEPRTGGPADASAAADVSHGERAGRPLAVSVEFGVSAQGDGAPVVCPARRRDPVPS